MNTIIIPSTRFDTSRVAFLEKVNNAVKEKFGTLDSIHAEYLSKELELIKTVPDEWLSYLLIASDLLTHMRTKYPFSVAEGRGAMVASFVAYLLNITDIDPVLYGLSLERFYVGAKTMPIPCVDVDIATKYKQYAVDYLTETYGKDNVIVPITKTNSGKIGVHACAYFITPMPYSEVCDLAKVKTNKSNVVNMDMNELETLGFIRFNLLSSNIQQQIMDASTERFNISDVKDFNELFSPKNIEGLSYATLFDNFRYTVNSFNDVMFVLAAARNYSLCKDAKKGTLGYNYNEPIIDGILKDTNGVILYQEQINDIFSYIFDDDYYQINSIRKDITKKRSRTIRHAFAKFTQVLTSKGMNPPQIIKLWEDLVAACETSLLKAHLVSVAYNVTEYLFLKENA